MYNIFSCIFCIDDDDMWCYEMILFFVGNGVIKFGLDIVFYFYCNYFFGDKIF